MGVLHRLEIELMDRNNRTLVGSMVIESFPREAGTTTLSTQESDPQGASSYVIAVVLIYGLSIVFLIGSHVFIKKKEENIHGEEGKIVDKYLQNSSNFREISNRETFKKLKTSIVPIVAQSPARDLISRRKSFLPFLASAGILLADPGGLMSGLKEGSTGEQTRKVSTGLKEGEHTPTRRVSTGFKEVESDEYSPSRKVSRVMPMIGEEEEYVQSDSDSEDLERALRSVERGYSGDSCEFATMDRERKHSTGGGSTSSRRSSIDKLSHARGYLSKMMREHSMLPQTASANSSRRSSMYKIVWVSGDGSTRSSRSSLVSGDGGFAAAAHGSRRSSFASSGQWSTEEVPRIAPPPSRTQGQRSRRASYGVYVQPSLSRESSSSTDSSSHENNSIKITSL